MKSVEDNLNGPTFRSIYHHFVCDLFGSVLSAVICGFLESGVRKRLMIWFRKNSLSSGAIFLINDCAFQADAILLSRKTRTNRDQHQ